MEKLLDHPGIQVTLNKKFEPTENVSGYDHVFYTGPIDAYFDFIHGRLGYRTVTFETHYAKGDHQGVTQMNYCDTDVPYTRITEHKHFTNWEQHDETVYFKEYSKETEPTDIPYYPKRLEKDKELLLKYRQNAGDTGKCLLPWSLSYLSVYGYASCYRGGSSVCPIIYNCLRCWP